MAESLAPLADRLHRYPVVGPILGNLVRALRLGRAFNKLNWLEDQRVRDLDYVRDLLAEHRAELQAAWRADFRSMSGEVDHRIDNLRAQWRSTLARDTKSIEHAIAHQLEASGRPTMAEPNLNAPDIYLAFEDAFRGDWKVKERMEWYVPQVKDLYAEPHGRPILDVGCGRGEWLQALNDNGIPAVGVDINAAMVKTSQEKGFDATLGDAIGHLRGLEPGVLGGVTAFHVVEHLPFERILHFLEAAYRALMPGGRLILETPNPENLTVGACTFWYDPTHIKPIPPALLKFYVEQAGFERAQIARFTLNMEGPDTATIDMPVKPDVDGPLDYSVMAYKPASA